MDLIVNGLVLVLGIIIGYFLFRKEEMSKKERKQAERLWEEYEEKNNSFHDSGSDL